MKLLVDVGNTRLKWAVLDRGKLSRVGAAVHRQLPCAEWLRGLDAIEGQPEALLVSNVAGPALADALGAWAQQRHGLQPRVVQASRAAAGIENSYDRPEALGADRWLGMIAAWRRVQGPVLCIAAGTAMTVDALDERGRHVGGLIVPGYDMMVNSLLGQTSDIARAAQIEPARAQGMLGRNTAAAIDLGACHALAALIERVAGWVARQGGAAPPVLLGGGDAQRIEPLLDLQVEIVPDLVLEGLAVMAEGE
jgi:type III pantothenate kinase